MLSDVHSVGGFIALPELHPPADDDRSDRAYCILMTGQLVPYCCLGAPL